jgi:hypothetical protein
MDKYEVVIFEVCNPCLALADLACNSRFIIGG